MTKKCPDCLTVAELQTDYASSFMESFLKSIGLIRIKRCANCNAAVFLVLGFMPTSRKKISILKERVFWLTFVLLLLVTGYVLFRAIVS